MFLSYTPTSDVFSVEIGGIATELAWSDLSIIWDLSHNIA